MPSFFPRDVLDETLNSIESVSEGFPSYSYVCYKLLLFFFFFFLLFILAGGECLGIFIQSSLDIYYVIQQDNSSIIPLKPSQLLYRPGPGCIISLSVAYNFIILHFDNFLGCL